MTLDAVQQRLDAVSSWVPNLYLRQQHQQDVERLLAVAEAAQAACDRQTEDRDDYGMAAIRKALARLEAE